MERRRKYPELEEMEELIKDKLNKREEYKTKRKIKYKKTRDEKYRYQGPKEKTLSREINLLKAARSSRLRAQKPNEQDIKKLEQHLEEVKKRRKNK